MIVKEGKIKISRIFNEISKLKGEEKIVKISELFLDMPYKKGSISEIAERQESLTIDFEGVDCMTFLEYVEALRLSYDYESFIYNLKYIRYFNGVVKFENRRHFFSDWDNIPTLKNITSKIGESYYRTTFKELNKRDNQRKWIEGLPIRLKKIEYIPQKYIISIIDKFDSICYCGFYTVKEGLDVTHVGIIIKQKNSFILRHASSIKGKVIDEPFMNYVMNKKGIILYKPSFNYLDLDKWIEKEK
ncbi:MAG: DUF1460 domain-containing protein [Thermodesulfovibrio sp.]|nr:DUF1460 domain-containing protein [Thermodesulfovibrio sp.]